MKMKIKMKIKTQRLRPIALVVFASRCHAAG